MNKAERFYALDSALGMSDKDFNFVRNNRYNKYASISRRIRTSSDNHSNNRNNRY